MEFLKYSNETQSNIIPQEEFEGLVKEVFGVISTNLCKSLGPLGSSATILDGSLTAATKDGYSILKKYNFRNKYKKMIYNLIMAPCTRMNNTVGDATTTAIALTNALFSRYEKRKDNITALYRLPRDFTKIWDTVISDLCEKIQSKAVAIDPEDYDTIYNLAYVTSNGNHEVSEAIAKTYIEAKTPSIKQKDSPTNKSYISAINGFDFPANLLNDAYVRNEDMTVEEKDVRIMVFDHKITTDFFNNVIVKINMVLRAMDKKFIVLAPSVDEYLQKTYLEQHIGAEFAQYQKLNLIMCSYLQGKLEPHQLDDLATILRTKVIDQNTAIALGNELNASSPDRVLDDIFDNEQSDLYRLIGTASEVLLTINTGAIFKVENIEEDQKYQDALRKAEKELADITSEVSYERQSYAAKIYSARARVMQLKMNNYIYYVGADSLLQKNIIWDSIEDVIKCLRSAIKYGTVPGCQLSIISSCTELINEMIGDDKVTEYSDLNDAGKLRLEILYLISAAVGDVYAMVLTGPDNMGMVRTINRWQYTKEEGLSDLWKEAEEKLDNVITESLKTNKVYDIESLEHSDKIITSAETDRMVLLAASELVKILISGNQCIFTDADLDNAEDRQIEAYV